MDVSLDKSYFENMSAVDTWGHVKNYAEIGEPVDKTEWSLSP
nr:hypothetical protein [Maribacter sp. ACAM166]